MHIKKIDKSAKKGPEIILRGNTENKKPINLKLEFDIELVLFIITKIDFLKRIN